MSASSLTLPYGQLFDHVHSFYSIKQLDTAFQKILHLISSVPQQSSEESIPFNQQNEIVWIPNQKLQEFVQSVKDMKPVLCTSKELLKNGAHSFFTHVISQLLITKLRIHVYKNHDIDIQDHFTKFENDINIIGTRIISTLDSLKEVEERINHFLQSNPIIPEFEGIYQRVLQAQQEGDQRQAKAYAAELSHRKSKYILATKVIQNDLSVMNQYYANVQMIHKSIISTEKMIMDKKEHFLSDRMASLNQSYQKEEQSLRRSQVLEVLQSQIELIDSELSNMNKRGEVILIKEKQIDQTLSQFQTRPDYNQWMQEDKQPTDPANTWIKIRTDKS